MNMTFVCNGPDHNQFSLSDPGVLKTSSLYLLYSDKTLISLLLSGVTNDVCSVVVLNFVSVNGNVYNFF